MKSHRASNDTIGRGQRARHSSGFLFGGRQGRPRLNVRGREAAIPEKLLSRRFRRRLGLRDKVVGLEGPPPPKRVGLTEWDSLEKAEAFYKSKAWTDLAPERDKAVKTIRRYAVEVVE